MNYEILCQRLTLISQPQRLFSMLSWHAIFLCTENSLGNLYEPVDHLLAVF